MNSKISEKIFSQQDQERLKSHQKCDYPEESSYKPKQKITKYKKSIFSTYNYKFRNDRGLQCKM